MKNLRGFALGLALGLAASVSTTSFAQNASPTDPKAKTESCCAMESCCCQGDSCSTKITRKTIQPKMVAAAATAILAT